MGFDLKLLYRPICGTIRYLPETVKRLVSIFSQPLSRPTFPAHPQIHETPIFSHFVLDSGSKQLKSIIYVVSSLTVCLSQTVLKISAKFSFQFCKYLLFLRNGGVLLLKCRFISPQSGQELSEHKIFFLFYVRGD